MAIIVFVATVIPFAIGGIAVELVVAPAYRSAVSRAAEEHTRRLSEHIAGTIGQEASRLEKLAAWTELRDLAGRGLLSEGGAKALESRWSRLPLSADELRPMLHNPVARELRWWRDTDSGITEILATDARGRTVAATGKPNAVSHTEEDWWRAATSRGHGRVYVSDPLRGDSPKGSSIDIAVPIYAEGAPGSAVLGVLKMSLDIERLFNSVTQTRMTEGVTTTILDSRGQELLRNSLPAVAERATETAGPEQLRRFRSALTGSAVFQNEGTRLLTTWARVRLEPRDPIARYRIPSLYVVTSRDTATAFGPLRQVRTWMLGIGLVTVALAVAVGSWLAEVLVVRQVKALARGMRELARGDFERATATAERLLNSRGSAPSPEGAHTSRARTAGDPTPT